MTAALGLAVHFDRPLCDGLEPLERVLDTQVAGTALRNLLTSMWANPIKRGARSRPPTPFNWPRLRSRILSRELQYASVGVPEFDVRTRKQPEQVAFGFDCFPPDVADEMPSRRMGDQLAHFRYESLFGVGPGWLQGGAANPIVDAMVRFAGEIDTKVGVIIAAQRFSTVMALGGAGGGDDNPDVRWRAGRLYGARWDWGPYAREPEWGTFLSREHADSIGGPDVIRSAVEPYTVYEADNLVYVQLTPYEQATAAITEEKRLKLWTLMQPIVLGPASWERPSTE
ncbi:MAG: hypothetical protein HOV81_14995 [Kofleriaceae bacterium]|nr:hypothetical protein [Kofleriaceae bacterium]